MACLDLLRGQLRYIPHDSRAPETIDKTHSLSETQVGVTNWLEDSISFDSDLLGRYHLALLSLVHSGFHFLQHADWTVLASNLFVRSLTL